MKRPLFYLLSFIVMVVLVQVMSTGCANIIPPEGGPRDSFPPRLLISSPADSTLNFKGDRVTFNFDEYIDLKEVQNNLLFLPLFKTNPDVRARLKTITVRFPDSLRPNTTYTLDFGNAITDFTEGNILKNYTYTFSTGSYIDSLTLAGRVTLAQTGGVDTTMLVELYKNRDDSAVIKELPQYVARVDRNGVFHFHNLPPADYAVYALAGSGSRRNYLNKTILFAFGDSLVKAGSADSVRLYAYSERQPVSSTTSTATTTEKNTEKRLRFNQPSGAQDLASPYNLIFTTPLKTFDSAKTRLTVDSTYTPVAFTVSLDSSSTVLSYRTQWREGAPYHLILEKDFAADSTGRQLLKSDTLDFSAKKVSDYAEVRLRIRGLDAARRPVLQFVQNNEVVNAAPVPNGVFTQKLFNPGEYELRILYDTNGNGVWDPGSFFGIRKQPELVIALDRKLNIRAGAENDTEIKISQ